MRSHIRQPSPTFCRLRLSSVPAWPRCVQVPEGLIGELAKTFHFMDVAAGMKLAAEGKVAHVVPFKHNGMKMTLYKGDDHTLHFDCR